jgi:hypothetical protein
VFSDFVYSYNLAYNGTAAELGPEISQLLGHISAYCKSNQKTIFHTSLLENSLLEIRNSQKGEENC